MWTPTHVVVTVTKGKNLLEKGKGGNDAYCMIGMGKEKFLTSVKVKTLSPVWDEQAEFQLGEREDLKITVYHKSSIIDEFVGRVLINIADLASQDNNHSYVNWYKLGGKPEKSEKSKKHEKDRGDIEVRIDFIIKPRAGSMMDLSLKSKEKSLSLRNLREKMSIKGSISDKFSKLTKSGQPKYSGENQLGDQARRMANGSKLDFLEGDDIGSITSSYSSINGPTLIRTGGNGQMSRYNQGRQSFVSRASSQGLQNDSSSIYNDNSRNDEDFDDNFKPNDDNESDRDSMNSGENSSFQRRNSSRFGSTVSRSNVARIKRPVIAGNSNTENQLNSTENNKTSNEDEKNGSSDASGGLYIAPLSFFNDNDTSTPLTPRMKSKNMGHDTKVSDKKIRHKTSSSVAATIDEDNILASSVRSPVKSEVVETTQAEDFASIFAESLGSDAKSPEKNASHSTITDSFEKSQSNSSGVETSPESSTTSTKQKRNAPVVTNVKPKDKKEVPKQVIHNPFLDDSTEVPSSTRKSSNNPFDDHNPNNNPFGEENAMGNPFEKQQAPVIPMITKNAKNMNNFPMANDDEDNIEWDSSEDEEIVKKEVASFERNQMMRQSERRRLAPVEDLTSDLNSETDFNHSTASISSSVRNNHNKPNKLKPQANNNRNTKSDQIQNDMDNRTFQDGQKMDSPQQNGNGLPDVINQKNTNAVPTDKARKYLEGMDGVKFNEIQVPDTLKKQLEYFDRDELLQLIAYQKKYLDFKETRIKDLENYIDNLVVKIIETEPTILMNTSNVLTKSKNLI